MAKGQPLLLPLPNGSTVPQLAFGLYKIPADEDGVSIVLEAIKAGYRHFDTASYYGNEEMLGTALKRSGLPRQDFFVVSKVWNDAQKRGREAVRQSVLRSVALLDFGGYYDLFLVHWPVPGCFIDTYKELEMLHNEGYLKNLGLSNFAPEEYDELMSTANNISVPPVVNQFEVSPFMYRADLLSFFENKGLLVSSSKSLHRGEGFDNSIIKNLSQKYRDTKRGCLRIRPTPAQIILRWGVQKGIIVVAKTATPSRMIENQDIQKISLSEEEMAMLDGLTSTDDVEKRKNLERERKLQL
ncbi:hypothetical protein HJC23_008858 [Cyclotella cryptica]|uniref:NADP-dependent oxidoreductase domain-containing protein n=1 Tax=Cyclotella cryptica TaxID=29204 RepID=A0ABD3P5P5_9STRA|eukprot:CCRYP_017615-RA/>CCRYP_017615-RA protein AED:0.06 eAED:0.06 QI:33/1/1/1/0.33/0/4/1643/297